MFNRSHEPQTTIKDATKVAELLYEWGEPKPEHYLDTYTEEMVQRGYDLIHIGKTKNPPEGENSRYISRFYKCTSCHNTQREDPDLSRIDPDARLKYALDKGIPYVQGSTFWAIANRESWYNDDYFLKYGDSVRAAKHSLIRSTQLCAVVCSQGRRLKDWEMESILAYYWSMQLTFKDLGLSKKKRAELEALPKEEAIKKLKSYYMQKSPATFGDNPESKMDGYGLKGRPKMGKAIYELSCQHCHRENGESDVVLDDYKSTFRWLKRNVPANSKLSIYEIIRKGTYSEKGHREYMPHYTLEKLSNQQLEDLRSYIEKMAK